MNQREEENGEGAVGAWVRSRDDFHADLLHSYETGKFYDCTFKVGIESNQKVIRCHKHMLAVVSSVFESMFYGDFKEATKGPDDPIEMSDTSPDAFDAAMRFIYGKQIAFQDVGLALQVYGFAHKMQISCIEAAIEELLNNKLEPSNVLAIFDAYLHTECDKGIKSCKKVLLADSEAALNADCFLGISKYTMNILLQMDGLTVDEINIFRALIIWGKAQLENQGKDNKDETLLRTQVNEFLKWIRFESMQPKDVAELCRETNIFSLEEQRSIFLTTVMGDLKDFPHDWGVEEKRQARESLFKVSISYTKGSPYSNNYRYLNATFHFSVAVFVNLHSFSLSSDFNVLDWPNATAIVLSNNVDGVTASFGSNDNATYKYVGSKMPPVHPGRQYSLNLVCNPPQLATPYTPAVHTSTPDFLSGFSATYLPVANFFFKKPPISN